MSPTPLVPSAPSPCADVVYSVPGFANKTSQRRLPRSTPAQSRVLQERALRFAYLTQNSRRLRVSRPHVVTRAATLDDLPSLLTLAEELREVGGRAERAINPLAEVDIGDRLAEVLLDPDCRIVTA